MTMLRTSWRIDDVGKTSANVATNCAKQNVTKRGLTVRPLSSEERASDHSRCDVHISIWHTESPCVRSDVVLTLFAL